MDDFVQSGEGSNGASYDLKSDPNVMLKLYFENYDPKAIISELEVAKKVYDLGVPTPEPGELVTDGKCLGIKFRRIAGKRSYARMLSHEPQRCDEFAREMARYCKKLHSTPCPKGIFPDVKDQFLYLLSQDHEFTPAQREVMAEFIKSAPDGDTSVHGDMHMGNLISTLPKGAPMSDPHEVYFIDIGYFASGCPLFDFGMLENICLYADDEYRFHDFHIHGDITAKFWDSFIDEYFFGADKLGEKWFGVDGICRGNRFLKLPDGPVTPATIVEAIKPFCAVKMMLVEYNLGFMPPDYIGFISKVFGF